MNYKLGKKPARAGAIKLQFGDVFDRSEMPKVPPSFGHERVGMAWGMFGNDRYSDCVLAGAAHEHMTWTHEGGETVKFSDAGVLSDYSALTGFKVGQPNTDQGTDMGQAAEYRRKTGVIDAAGIRHKVDSYVAPRVGDVGDLALVTFLMGACGVGLELPNSAMDQLDKGEPWTVTRGSGNAGGHYVACIGRSSKGNFLVITWGAIQAMTPEFYAEYSDESVGYLSLEVLRGKVSPEGFDEAALRGYLAKLGKSAGLEG